ncbi:NAD(P)H-binding protein [Nocardioidaceae bacterium]|nr:NAD(P)H-binding protein [Nocardioidaceae bacterium]
MDPMSLTVLVTGATGFVGGHLVPALLERGHEVRAMTRRPEAYDGPGSPVHGDVEDPASLEKALDGVDVAYYFVHSLDSADFAEKDAAAARAFGKAAASCGVRQIVYLGGLGADGDPDALSPHLRSRRDCEAILAEGGVPVTVLRAAIVIGHGGISWELTRQLVKNLPLMVAPKWVSTRSQPVALTDVIRYLVGVLDNDEAKGKVLQIGGTDVLTYRQMMERASHLLNGRKARIVQVPLLTPRLSSYWLSLVTDVDVITARHLIDSMDNEVVVTDDTILSIVPGEPLGYDESVRQALRAREEAGAA